MTKEIQEILDKLQQTKDLIKVIPDYFWLEIDRYNEEAVKLGEDFNNQFGKTTTNLGNVINAYSIFIKKSFVNVQCANIAKLENAIKSVELLPNDEIKQLVWQSFFIDETLPSIEKMEELKKEITNFYPKNRVSIVIARKDKSGKIVDLDTSVPYYLDNDFSGKKPFAFSILGNNKIEVNYWSEIYVLSCKYMFEQNIIQLENLINNESLTSKKGIGYFSKNKTDFIRFEEISSGIFADTNLSANMICQRIKKLAEFFEIPVSEIKIYLSKDRKG